MKKIYTVRHAGRWIKSATRKPEQIDKDSLKVNDVRLVFFNHLIKKNQHLNPNPIPILLRALRFRYADFGFIRTIARILFQ
ncbi:MAG: hypothetical protein ABIL14_04475 [candidate division WOR-3 bacterium]